MLVPLQLVSHRMKTLCGGQSRLVATVGVGGDTLRCSDGSRRQVEEPLLLPGTRSHPRHPVASLLAKQYQASSTLIGGFLPLHKSMGALQTFFKNNFRRLPTKINDGISEICSKAKFLLDTEQFSEHLPRGKIMWGRIAILTSKAPRTLVLAPRVMLMLPEQDYYRAVGLSSADVNSHADGTRFNDSCTPASSSQTHVLPLSVT